MNLRLALLTSTLAFALGGCNMNAQRTADAPQAREMAYQRMTSGVIGCPPTLVRVSQVRSSARVVSWTAECAGQVYYCSGTTTGFACAVPAPQLAGTEHGGPELAAETVPSTSPAGS